MTGRGRDWVDSARSAVPAPLVPLVARTRASLAWRDASHRQWAIEEMAHLFADAHLGRDAETLGREFARMYKLRGELRMHPELVTRQRIENVGVLVDRDPDRPCVLNFVHHGHFDGLFGSLARHGVRCHVVTDTLLASPDGPPYFAQHLAVVRTGGAEILWTSLKSAGLLDRLQPGVVMAIASDVPGNTEVSLFGRRWSMASGAARLAHATSSPVVLATYHRDADGPFVRLSDLIEPATFAGPEQLLQHLMERHEPAITAWPEAVEQPTGMWKRVQAGTA